ncbi:MAG: shikimate kinase [Nautilia sp.]|nr:MAG: shikimate kinase [Nautilia sp.]
MLNKNIILTGFMGSGKSTIGRILAKKLEHSYFLDTDALIEHFENREISDIFLNEGEEYFRDAEKRVFNWIKNDVKNAIISTGGGLPMFIPEIKEAGIVIYLKVDFEKIVQRLDENEIKKRPLFSDLKQAKILFEKRDKVYTKLSDYTIENDNIEKSIIKILELI